MRVFTFLFPALLSLPIACSDDGDGGGGGAGGPFPGVVRWQCYADETFGECDCYGLMANEQLDVAGPTPVDSCAGYVTCATYRDFVEDPVCSCGAEDYTPENDATEVQPAQQCPPS